MSKKVDWIFKIVVSFVFAGSGFVAHAVRIDGKVKKVVIADRDFVCALSDDGIVKCWGDRPDSAVIVGKSPEEMGDYLLPVDFGNGVKVLDIVSSSRSLCVLTDSRRVKCLGSNLSGELGLGIRNDSFGKIKSQQGDQLPFVNLGYDTSGDHWKVKGIFATSLGYCAVLEAGGVKCWGYLPEKGKVVGRYQSEMGEGLPFERIPEAAKNIRQLLRLPSVTRVRSIVWNILTEEGKIISWGSNAQFELGLGTKSELVPLEEAGTVDLGRDFVVSRIETSAGSRFALSNLGTLKGWGNNAGDFLVIGRQMGNLIGGDAKQMGDNLPLIKLTSSPNFPPHIKDLACAENRFCIAVFSNCAMKYWAPSPTVDRSGDDIYFFDLSEGTCADSIVFNGSSTYCVVAKGRVKCWGSDSDRGLLGRGRSEGEYVSPQRSVYVDL